MAKRKRYYYQERQSNRRRLVLAFMLILAGGAVVWKFYSENQSKNGESQPDLMLHADDLKVTGKPEVITSEQIIQQIQPAANQTQEPDAHLPITKPVITEAEPLNLEPPKESIETAKPPETSLGDASLLKGRQAIAVKDYFTAGKFLSDAVAAGLNPNDERLARKLINQASDQWLLSPNFFENDPFSIRYKVQSGDMLVNIGKTYSVPYPLLMKINGIRNAAHLRAGQSLKVIQGPFQAKVYRKNHRLDVYLGEILVRSYPVGLGKPGRQTPTGLWCVRPGKKQVNPAWTDVETGKHYYPDDPENPLGERWISLEGLEGDAFGRESFGIHGTIKPDEIGQNTSRGCIRLHNRDVIELYDLLAESKSKVWVME
jgi:lipoprotein-anchoring transpeptidase ErfK/SrfK